MKNNFALAAPVAMIFDSIGVESVIESSQFHQNHIIDYITLKREIYEFCKELCFFKEEFRIALRPQLPHFAGSSEEHTVIVTKSKLSFHNVTLDHESAFLVAFSSEINFDRIKIHDIVLDTSFIVFVETHVKMIDSTVNNVALSSESHATAVYFFDIDESFVTIERTHFNNIAEPLIKSIDTKIDILNSDLVLFTSLSTTAHYIMEFVSSKIVMKHTFMTKIKTNHGSVMHTSKCTLTMEDVEFYYNEAKSIDITDSRANLTRASFHDNINNRGIYAKNSELIIDAGKF